MKPRTRPQAEPSLSEYEQFQLTLALTAWRDRARVRYQLDQFEIVAMSNRHFHMEFPQ